MSNITAKQHLEYAVSHAGQAVLEASYSDLHWVKGQYFLRVIFPCFIYQKEKYRIDLPDCSRCNFVFIIMEREISSEARENITKLKKRLSDYAELQIEIAASLLREILSEFEWARKKALCLRESISLALGKKRNRLFADETMDMRAIKFCWSDNRTSLISPTDSKFPFPAKQLMRKRSKEVYQLYFKQFFQPQQEGKNLFLPRGWVDSGAVPFYFGREQLKSESAENHELGDPSALVCETEQLLSLVPYSISIPLFSFTLFSILKYFYPGYPNRISAQDSYQHVKQNLGKILYLALDCENQSYAQEIAELYCGAFLRHSLPGSPARDEESKYIHDGVLIVSERDKKPVSITEKNMDSFIVRNACALFVNLPLPESASPVRVVAKVNEPDANSTNLAAYRDRVDALLRYFIRKFEQYVGQSMADWIKGNPEKYPETLSKLPDHEQCMIWRKKFLELYKNTVAANQNRAKAYLTSFSTDKIHTEKCTYLLSAYLLFMDFVGCFDVSENSKLIDRLRQAGIFEFQCLCRGYDWSAQMETAFAAYVSELLETKAIAPVRGPQTGKTFGWFDSKKQLLLLPYSGYYERFLKFYQERYEEKLCCTKSAFQMNFLAKFGFIQLKPNGKQSGYLRADCRIEVGPAGEKEAHKENVVKISVESFRTSAPLSQKAAVEIEKMNSQTFKRRAPNRKQQRPI